MLKVIGSDAHTMLEVGRNYIDISIIPSDPCTFINAVKTGVFHKKKCILFCHFITKVAKIINIIRKGNFDELYRIVIRKYNKRK